MIELRRTQTGKLCVGLRLIKRWNEIDVKIDGDC
jgi:hypothetical protein